MGISSTIRFVASGRRLMRHVVDAMGTTPLTLHATPYGQPLYEELGFKVTGRAEMLRGHFTGHYMSACALLHAQTGDQSIKARGDVIARGVRHQQGERVVEDEVGLSHREGKEEDPQVGAVERGVPVR